MGRRKNPHPKRAVNARTVLKVAREEEEPNLVLCSRIPDEEDGLEANHHQIQKEEEEEEEEITVRKEKERARVRCLREGVSISITFGQTHAYAYERETVRM